MIGERIDEAAKLTHGVKVHLMSKGHARHGAHEFAGDVCTSNDAPWCSDGVATPVAAHPVRIERVEYSDGIGINRDAQRGRKARGGKIGRDQFMERC